MPTIRDRQVFEQHTLANGIEVFHYPSEVPFTTAGFELGVGSAHSTGDYLPGTFHFLEHMVINASKQFAEPNLFARQIGLKGGGFGGEIGPFDTTYRVTAPTEHFSDAWAGLLSHLKEPLFKEAWIANERGVIASERKRLEHYFPSDTEIGAYVHGQWMDTAPITLRQRLGEDEDLISLNVKHLEDAHKAYSSCPVRVLIGGSAPLEPLLEDLKKIKRKPAELKADFKLSSWKKRQYHEQQFRDINRYGLRWGGVFQQPVDILTIRTLNFIFHYLTNTVHGALYRWLREEKGWIYDLNFSTRVSQNDFSWILFVPLANREQVITVRRELWERARAALAVQDQVNLEVERVLGLGAVYSFQTLGEIMNNAQQNLSLYNRIIPEKELVELTEKCRDTRHLLRVFDQYLTGKAVGSFLAVPAQG